MQKRTIWLKLAIYALICAFTWQIAYRLPAKYDAEVNAYLIDAGHAQAALYIVVQLYGDLIHQYALALLVFAWLIPTIMSRLIRAYGGWRRVAVSVLVLVALFAPIVVPAVSTAFGWVFITAVAAGLVINGLLFVIVFVLPWWTAASLTRPPIARLWRFSAQAMMLVGLAATQWYLGNAFATGNLFFMGG